MAAPPSASDPAVARLVDLTTFLAKLLVDRPDEVTVEDMDEEDGLVIELTVAEEDLGKVIGRQGRTAKAMRTVLSAAAAKTSKRRVILEILE
jgi:predicted RNA-binding protein YlqC (UPF0109 family)